MTPQPPSLEDLLRERLHEVDSITPPDTSFEARALRGGRARANRRRSWVRGLVGVAAAAVIGVFVVPSVMRASLSNGGSAASSAGAAATPGAAAPYQAPEQAPNSGGGGKQGLGDPNSAPQGPPTGPNDTIDREVEAVLVTLRGPLSRTHQDSFTALELEDSTSPPRVVLHMTVNTPAALRMVRDAVSPEIPVVFEESAYSASACASTFQALSVDTEWAGRGVQLAPKNCDNDGRVAVSVIGRSASAVISDVRAKYGDRVVAAVSGQQ